jgi:hypothetical protein
MFLTTFVLLFPNFYTSYFYDFVTVIIYLGIPTVLCIKLLVAATGRTVLVTI